MNGNIYIPHINASNSGSSALTTILSLQKDAKKKLHRRKQQYISHTANKNRKKTNADHLETEIKYFVFI